MKPYEIVALGFANAIINENYASAYGFLSPTLQDKFSATKIRDAVYSMFSGYAPHDRPSEIWYDPQFALERWPAAKPDDLASVYVGISGKEFNEAVTVIVSNFNGTPLIREIEWGRP